MTFGPNHYVPVLKLKRGEKAALQSIAPALCSRLTPLLEIIERTLDRPIAKHLDAAFKDLAAATSGFQRVFLDAREIANDGPSVAQEVFSRAVAAGIRFVPVTGVCRTSDVSAALAHRTDGFALRVTREEFEAGDLNTRIIGFLAHHHLGAPDVDLIVDLGAVDSMVSVGVVGLTAAFLSDVPFLQLWRTLTVSGCAFPPSMGIVGTHSNTTVERCEWIAWRDGLYASRNQPAFTRLPTFSDCGIQHPKGVEGFDPRIMQVSATVRYTTAEDWLLIKGESTRTTPPSEQFPNLAMQLTYGHLSGQFDGTAHCSGCASMRDAADGLPRLGSAEVWRRLGTIHHITKVIDGLDALAWP